MGGMAAAIPTSDMRVHARSAADLLAFCARPDAAKLSIGFAASVPGELLERLAEGGTHVFRLNGDQLGFYGRPPTRTEQRALRRVRDALLASVTKTASHG
jgi:hypothetical protein